MIGLKLKQRNSIVILKMFSFCSSFIYLLFEFFAHFFPDQKDDITNFPLDEKSEKVFDRLPSNSTMNVAISIIIPVYNSAQTLKRCLNSVVDGMLESANDVEVIIVNDGSPDNSDDIVKPYLEHGYFVYVHQNNCGFSGARNTGIKMAKGEYVYFLDSDDQLKPGAIMMMRKVLKRKADLVQFSYEVESNGKTSEHIFDDVELEKCDDVFEHPWSGFPWGKLMKKELIMPFGFPEGFWFEDTVLPAIVFPRVNSYVLSSFVVQQYFINPEGITVSAKRNTKSLDHYRVSEYLFREQCELGLVPTVASVSFWREHLTARGFARIRQLNSDTKKLAFKYFCRIMAAHPEFLADNRSVKSRVINLSVNKHLYFLWKTVSFLG